MIVIARGVLPAKADLRQDREILAETSSARALW
jgi:hypothetical protein